MTDKPTYEALEQRVRELENNIVYLKRMEVEFQDSMKMQQLFESLNEVIYTLDQDARVTFISSNVENVSGYAPEEIIGRRYVDFIHPDDRLSRIDHFRRILAGEGIATEYRIMTRDRVPIWVMTNARPVLQNGKVTGIQGILVDITERREAERRLREKEERYRFLVEASNDIIWTFDLSSMRYTYCSKSVERILGFSQEEASGASLDDVFSPAMKKKVMVSFSKAITGAGDANRVLMEAEHHRRDGESVWMEINAVLHRDECNQPVSFTGVSRDITERKLVETALRKSERKFRDIFDGSSDAIYILDMGGRFLEVNESACTRLGYTRDELLRMTPVEIDTQAYGRQVSERLRCIAQTGNMIFESVHRRKDGVEFPVEVSSRKIEYDGTPCILSMVRDITERKQAEVIMLQQQRTIRLNNRIVNVFLTATPEGIYTGILDVILDALESRYGYFGYIDHNENLICPTLTNEAWEDCKIADKGIVFPPAAWRGLWGRSLMEKKTILANKGLRVPDGHLPLENAMAVPIVHHDKVIGQFVVANKPGGYTEYDRELLISVAEQTAPILNARLNDARQGQEREKLEKQLHHAQRMESIGMLAGGIAHDFNNILFSVIGYTELSIDEIQKGTVLHQNLSEVLSAGNRAKDLVKQILIFSRHNQQDLKPTYITPLVREALKMLRCTIPTSIEFREDICRDQLIVQADPTQIHQVIMNLVTNAMHAMADGEGILEICVEPISFNEGVDRKYIDIAPGDYARVTVSDTGMGIPGNHLDRIFEPYFTTKEVGKGSGLGLSVVHGIVKSHKGHITVYSEPGKGSTFHVYFPLAESLSAELGAPFAEPLPTGTERILLVDDEPAIVKMQQQSLERLGYSVTARTGSIEALEAFRALPDKFDLVITDMTMPNMTGDKLARFIKEIRPAMPVILCTGFSEKIHSSKNSLDIESVMMKPVDKRKMAKTIRRLIDRAKGNGCGRFENKSP